MHIPIILLAFILTSPLLLIEAEKPFNIKCENNESFPLYANTTGKLTISSVTSNCSWNWLFNSTTKYKVISIQVQEINLDVNDKVTLRHTNGTVLDEFSPDHPGIFFADIFGIYSFTLIIEINTASQSKLQRSVLFDFGIYDQLSLNLIQSVKYLDYYHIPLNKGQKCPPINLTVDLSPQTEMTLINVVSDPKSLLNLNGGTSDILADLNQHVTLFAKVDPSAKIILDTERVAPYCSKAYAKIDKEQEIKFDLPPDGQNLVHRPCIQLLSSQNNILLDLSGIDSFWDNAATLTVHNGPRITSDVAFVMDSNNIHLEKSKLSNKLFGQNVVIAYRAQSIENTSLIKLMARSSVFSKINSLDVNISGKDPNDDLFLYKSAEANRTAFTITNTDRKAIVDTYFYCEDNKDAKPFLTIPAKTIAPSTIYSPTNFLRIRAVGQDSYQGKFTTGIFNSTTLCEEFDSFILKASRISPSQSISWLVPAREKKTLVLQVPVLYFVAKDDYFTIHQLTDQEKLLLTEKYSDSIQSEFLPTIKLNGSYSYVLTYTRGSTPSSDGQKVLLSASIAFIDPQLPSVVTLANQDVLSPPSYPNSLEYFSKETFFSYDGSLFWNVRSNAFIYATFDDFNLKGGQSLDIYSSKLIQYNASSEIPVDILTRVNLTLQLKSDLPSINARNASGRGFRVSLQNVPCGGDISYPATSTLSSPYYPLAFNESECIWIVRTENKLLEMNVTFGTGDQNAVNLTIIDGDTARGNFLVNISRLNETLISSKNVVIIHYKLVNPLKPGPGLNMTFSTTDCTELYKQHNMTEAETCYLDHLRCILPEWKCNGHNDCHDWSDERNCNGTHANPDFPTAPIVTGVSGWVIVLVIIPISILVGYLMHMYGPQILSRVRGSRSYSEFSNLAEDT